jgi:serine/threonine protein phosphatase PrpC
MNTPLTVVDNLYTSYGADNASYIICTKSNKALYFIVDGHSQRVGSAELVKLFVEFLQKSINLELLDGLNIVEEIHRYLLSFKDSIKRKLPRAAMCFVLVARINDHMHIFYLGDCRLGKFVHDDIEWITKPHSCVLQSTPLMTEEELRLNEFNHIIYKQFTPMKFSKSDYVRLDWEDVDYILATDGFWKLLPERQRLILDKKSVLLEDDVAFLKFR